MNIDNMLIEYIKALTIRIDLFVTNILNLQS